MSRQIAAKAYTEPVIPAVEPPTTETLDEVRTKVEQFLNANDQRTYDETEVVHRVKMELIKGGNDARGFDIRQCISELIDSGIIQEIGSVETAEPEPIE